MDEAQAFDESLAQVTAAEALGFDSVWLAEIHFQKGRSVLSSPLVIATAIAARTQRIRIGIAVQILPLAHPLHLAEDVATVDHLSKGRLDFGVGRSGLPEHYEGFNVPHPKAATRSTRRSRSSSRRGPRTASRTRGSISSTATCA
jgi:alkanesulfonate monooxygenase SsuD/methylene tetrahydromethanopterin reductase-like flavin-dependent oxidoreductase (luciferase family)